MPNALFKEYFCTAKKSQKIFKFLLTIT